MSNNDSRIVRFASGTGRNMGKATNQTKSYKTFLDDFRRPMVTPERQKDYQKMSETDQKHLKGVAGWIYRTQVDGPVRNRGSGLPSDFITLDLDYATPEFLAKLMSDDPGIDCEFFIHSTRSYTPEKPRLRMFILLEKAVPNEIYGPASRITAQLLDPDMTHVDKVSFRPAQMMFRPTASKDQEFVFYRHKGPAFDWSDALDAFELTRGDWRDIANLPITPGEKLREVQEKAENPTEKVGPIGDFCRAYDIPAAIEKFLPDKYTPSDDNSAKPRYTYLGGTTTNGAEVQDDGLFLYSHHGSDPCSDRLVNAFDMVMIHLFGDLDKGKDEADGPMAKRPSFKAMMDFIGNDKEYLAQVVKSKYDVAAMTADFTDDMAAGEVEIDEDDDSAEIAALVGVPAARPVARDLLGAPQSPSKVTKKKKAPPKKEWIGDLELTQNGDIISNAPNIAQIIQNDLRLRESFEHNAFMEKTVSRFPIRTKLPYCPTYPVDDPVNGTLIEDHHLYPVKALLQAPNGPGKLGYGLKAVSQDDLFGAVEMAARMNSFNPVVDFLESGKHDGMERAERLFIDYCGTPDTPYYRAAARLFLLGAVARAYEPGHKFDFAPILSGGQGKGKTTLIKILAKSWYGELKADFSHENKLIEAMFNAWIMELPELSSVGRSRIEDVKAFISGTTAMTRLAWARLAKLFKKKCVFIGSTNDDEYLIDNTGNRRFWPIPVRVEMIDTEKLARNVDQIWWEATAMFHAMRASQPQGDLPLFMTGEALREAEELQEEARVTTESDGYAEALAPYLDKLVASDDHEDFNDEMQDGAQPRPLRHRRAISVFQCWTEGLNMGMKHTRADSTAIGVALRINGWKPGKGTKRLAGDARKHFVPGPALIARWNEEANAAAKPGRAKDDDDDGSNLI